MSRPFKLAQRSSGTFLKLLEGKQMVYHASNQNSAPLEFTMSAEQINHGALLAVPSETTFKTEIGNTDE